MIQTIITHQCPRCGSENMVRNGRDYKGSQKYHCKACDSYGTLQASQGYDKVFKEQIQKAFLERLSLRGIERVFDVSRHTVSRWVVEWAANLPPLEETLAPVHPDDVLELDELWSFVACKANKRWVWVALCRRTRQIVAYFIGDRSEASCRQLWRRIPTDYLGCQSFSDFWEAYQNVFSAERHQSVGKESGETNHVERWFNTLRQRIARFVRKTLSFSKTDRFHQMALQLFIHHHNQLCIS